MSSTRTCGERAEEEEQEQDLMAKGAAAKIK